MCSMKKKRWRWYLRRKLDFFFKCLHLFSRGLFHSQGSLTLWPLKNFLPFVRYKRVVHEQSYYLYFSDRLPFGQLYLMSFTASTSIPSAHKFQRFFVDRRSTAPKCWFLLNRTLVLTVCNHYTSYQILLCYSFSEINFVANSVTATAVLLTSIRDL